MRVVKELPFGTDIDMTTGAELLDVISHDGQILLLVEIDPEVLTVVTRHFVLLDTGQIFTKGTISVVISSWAYVGSTRYGNAMQHVYEITVEPGHVYTSSRTTVYEKNRDQE